MSADSIWNERHAVEVEAEVRRWPLDDGRDWFRLNDGSWTPRSKEDAERRQEYYNTLHTRGIPASSVKMSEFDALFFHRGPNGGIDTNKACIVRGLS